MASVLTDEAREERYFRLRARKKRLDKIMDICMWASGIYIVGALLTGLYEGFMYGFFIGELRPFFGAVLSVAASAFAIYGLYQRGDWRISLAAAAGCAVPMGLTLGASMLGVASIALCLKAYVDVQWKKLSQEEGFPDFTITFHELKERKQSAEAITRRRALEAGIRVDAATLPDTDMADLLDADTDRPVLSAALHGYHERSQEAHGTETVQEIHVGEMDELV